MTRQSEAMDTLRERVQEELSRRHATIAWLAGEAGISTVHMSRILGGKADASVPVAEQIANALGLSISELFERSNMPA